VFLVSVVLDVRDVAVLHGDVLEDEGLAAAAVVSDPVNAGYERVLAGFDEFVGSYPSVARPAGCPLRLLLEDRPGLVGALSAGGFAPPEEAALDAPPNRVRREQSRERFRVAVVESPIRGAD
jgi:hypothetical protein